MRQLLVMENAEMAQTLIDYLKTQQIPCHLNLSEYGAEIWLEDEQKLQQAELEIRRFMAEPGHPRYRSASWQVGQSSLKLGTSGLSGVWSNVILHAGPLTLVIAALAIVIYLSGFFGYEQQLFYALSFHTRLEALWSWQIWRYISPALFHFSLMALVFNLLWWWYFGGMIERHKGSLRLLWLLVLGAGISNMVQFLVSGPAFGGLSGVVYVLLGYVWWSHWLDRDSPFSFPKGLVILMLVWLVLGFFDFFSPSLANAAHLTGLVVGCLEALVEQKLHRKSR
ncbi:rhomboid family intramembrane serine protease GlpG [Dongshaea marina]|uniref:rhomboid family intramembrane serine protease GlpG n=1 Tax=Dongshaea marina TaxID=2047966 RepID=UPI000D3E6444|nr:rhomboid family intramembrane serine protease GlpG [Dongshaea marina]